MKKLVVLSSLALAILSSCATQKTGTSTYNDDVYANPKEDRVEEARIKEEKKAAQALVDKRYNDSIAAVAKAQKEKDDANPYYKDPEFKYDDYYDYEYATRVKRFNNNINGLSYYDNYYTNSYFYNQNPYNYGVSVYNGYSWWGSSYNNYSYNPSVSFYNSWGWGYGNQFNTCYNGYNPYMAGYSQGYNNGFNNGMFGNYYGYGSPYGGYGNSFGFGSSYGYGNYGYGNYGYSNPYGYGGYNNPYYNGWGYYNAYDYNSSYTYGPRNSYGGGNSRRTTTAGMAPVKKEESPSDKYIREVAQQQGHVVTFDSQPVRGIETSEPIRVNSDGTPFGTGGIKPVKENNPIRNVDNSNEPVRNNPIRYNEGMDPVRNAEPVRNTEPVRTYEQPATTPTRNNPIRNNPIRNNEPVRNQPETTPRNETPIRNSEPVRQPQETPRNETPRSETPRQNTNIFQAPTTSPSNNGGGNTSPSDNNGGGHRPR